jgi:creatinine deaminase
MSEESKYRTMLDIAIEEARVGLSEGGIPIGAVLFNRRGDLLGRGRNRLKAESIGSANEA